jgi:hypothetical protein
MIIFIALILLSPVFVTADQGLPRTGTPGRPFKKHAAMDTGMVMPANRQTGPMLTIFCANGQELNI